MTVAKGCPDDLKIKLAVRYRQTTEHEALWVSDILNICISDFACEQFRFAEGEICCNGQSVYTDLKLNRV